MLNKDQRERLKLLRTMGGEDLSRTEALEALENNNWDTAMAFEWIKRKKTNPNISKEEFHAEYDEARKKAASVLPQDRYDLNNNKKQEAPSNRAARRAAKKKKK